MRGSRAKQLRREDPSRPNPGRVHGGAFKEQEKAAAQKHSMRWLKRRIKKNG